MCSSDLITSQHSLTARSRKGGLRLLEAEESKLELLRAKLAQGEAQLDRGESTDGETFMQNLID